MELLRSGRASVLVNGSPSDEFQIPRGLRLGDPFSPFLFILVMEGLHVALLKAHTANVFRGISINRIDISYSFYVDDAVLMSKWDPKNVSRVIRILRCVYIASGLKINLQKCKLIVVGVHFAQVNVAARKVGCAPDSCPFIHLGVLAGQNMSRISAWSSVVDRFRSKLLGWKAK
ncbi:uncharacterized protein LOC128129070 [Lactuca sativa]|uniref:uncharacterized protein LOC128129070 n=1 Tax=Lactuca sativa TaxID=4236 RepID=UPI0022AE865E|nr:uncharacterized protein LOC128129070 [Lactuca sativa]